MDPHNALFFLSDSTDPEDVLSALADRFRLDVGEPLVCTRRYLDTFDWRLYRAETTLFLETCGGRRRLWWLRRGDGAVLHQRPARGAPRRPEDLPEGAFQSALANAVGVRAVIPLVMVRFTRLAVNVLNDNDKTVARLRVETLRHASDPDGPRTSAEGTYVRLLPVRGYGEAWHRIHDALTDRPGVDVAPEALLDRAVALIGRTPGDTVADHILTLDPEDRADVAVRAVLAALLRTMMLNETGMLANLDPEFLHDYRVALRRARTVLGQFKDVFEAETAARFQEELRTLFRAMGPLRDLHVYLTDFDVYRSWLPPGPQLDLTPLRTFLEEREALRHRELVDLLHQPDYRRLMDAWHAFVHASAPEPPPTPEAALPIRVLAARRTWAAYIRVVKQGKALRRADGEAPAERLHRLRINCKKLRYLMELFRSLYPPEQIDRLIETLKVLQDNLGAIQDYRVQQENLHRFALEMQDDPDVEIRTFLAMGRLEAHLERLQREARGRFAETFRGFARPKNRRRFARLFREE